MRILFLAHLFPLPLDSGGKIKSFYTLKALASSHDVRLIAFVRNDEEARMLPEIKAICENVDVVPLTRGSARQGCDLFSSLITGRSFIVSRDYRSEMRNAVQRSIKEFSPDVIHIDHLQMAQFVDWNAPYKTVLDHHNVESTIIKRIAETSSCLPMRAYASIEWPKLRKYEIDVCKRCDLVLTVSEEDAVTLRSLGARPENINDIPIGVDVDYFTPVERDAESKNILSIGTMYWPPNVDSVLYFHQEILPLVRRDMPECLFTIAGQRPAPAVQALDAHPWVRVTGYVDDVREIARDCGVFVVPLRSGSGVRVKILNALAMGLPVVSTSVGAEGLDVTSGEHLLIADDPGSFAQAVLNVLIEPELAERLSHSGRRLVCERYSWESIGAQLLSVYEQTFNRLETV